MPLSFLFNEIKSQIHSWGFEDKVKTHLLENCKFKDTEINSIIKEVGLTEEEIYVLVTFKDKPQIDYRFYINNDKVHQAEACTIFDGENIVDECHKQINCIF